MESKTTELPGIVIIKAPEPETAFSATGLLSKEGVRLSEDYNIHLLVLLWSDNQKDAYHTQTITKTRFTTVIITLKTVKNRLLRQKRLITAVLAGIKIFKNVSGEPVLLHLHGYHSTVARVAVRVLKSSKIIILTKDSDDVSRRHRKFPVYQLSDKIEPAERKNTIPVPVDPDFFAPQQKSGEHIAVAAGFRRELPDDRLIPLLKSLRLSGFKLWLSAPDDLVKKLQESIDFEVITAENFTQVIPTAQAIVATGDMPMNTLYHLSGSGRPLLVISPGNIRNDLPFKWCQIWPPAGNIAGRITGFLRNKQPTFDQEEYDEVIREHFATDIFVFKIKKIYEQYLINDER